MRNPDNPQIYRRLVTFDRIGLHTEVAPLSLAGTYPDDFTHRVRRHAARYLSDVTQVEVHGHQDLPEGQLTVKGRLSQVLGSFTVSLPEPTAQA